MGGTIGFTIRKPDGNVVSRGQWTNGLDFFIDNIRLCQKDPELIERLIKRGDDPIGIYPVSYGLILVDCVRNEILDMNSYHSFGQFHSSTIKSEMSSTNITGHGTSFGSGKSLGKKVFGMQYASCRLFKEFWEDGRVKRIFVLDRNDGFEGERLTAGMSLMDFVKLAHTPHVYAFAYLNMLPFTVRTFPQTKDGCAALYEAVKGLDLPLTESDHATWAEYMERYSES